MQCSDESNSVQYCLDCVVEGRRCDHLKSFRFTQIIAISSCRQLMDRAVRAYNKLCGCTGGGENLVALQPQDVSSATIAFNLVELAKEDQRATCHQCKLAKSRHRMAFCANQVSEVQKRKPRPCCKKFCAACLWNRYMIKQVDCLKQKFWECPFCRKECNCSACLRKRGIDPSTYELPFIIPHDIEEGNDDDPSTYHAPRPRLRRKRADSNAGAGDEQQSFELDESLSSHGTATSAMAVRIPEAPTPSLSSPIAIA
jgi:hypothetical protein